MQFFRIRLILALVVGITLVSVASTYFEVLSHKHVLRRELERRTAWLSTSLQPEMEKALAGGRTAEIAAEAERLRSQDEALGLAVYDMHGGLVAEAGPAGLFGELPRGPLDKAIQKGINSLAFGHLDDKQWLEEAVPLYDAGRMVGALVILEDARSIHAEGVQVWRQSFWRIAAFVLLIVSVTLLMVRWFLMRPMVRVAARLRRLRIGQADDPADESIAEMSLFTPLAREVETMAESLMEARAAARTEAQLRDAGEHHWTAERLAVQVRERFASSRIFVLSNREPYMHVRQGRETVCVVPPSGLVTAIEPVLRACDGVWVAHGSGSEDAGNVDEFDRLRVPPDDPCYTLRRVWLSVEEEAGYYDGFANEGLWPLCHIAHTRPIFRASDWECYQRVNEKFAAALLEEMEGSVNPIAFVQDYHLALAPRLIKAARPDARVAIFWHIPWPNPEAFGICPWQAELLDGLLGADLIGFHIPLHCNNFLSTVDRVLESRTDREHMTARRNGHTSCVRPYPVSVALDGSKPERKTPRRSREELLKEFGLSCETMIVGVDRMDYTKGIVERLMAIEKLFEEHPFYLERLTMVQIAAPSRSRIPSYVNLRLQVEETVERINQRYQTALWKPILLIERQCSHADVDLWYRAAAVCLVTSLHDGMNLVAKEYVAARDDEDGVLVLSKFTGAATELRDALIVNPYDIEGVAKAIHQGLEMDHAERCLRMQRMRHYVMDHNIYRWAASILGDLSEIRMETPGATDLRHALPASVSPSEMVHRKQAKKASIR
ncbi:MAG: trehalose-6-phosphate synthase [Terracidiphilus sp.]|nr:trehalose-6-phosphate synthase [Terracidiphilus sp.]